MTDEEALEELAQLWESDMEAIGELSGSHDIVGPIENARTLLCVMQLRYVIKHGEIPDTVEDLDVVELTTFPVKSEQSDFTDIVEELKR